MVLLLGMLVFLSSWSQILTSHGDGGVPINTYQAVDVKSSLGIRKAAAMTNQQYVMHAPIEITNNAGFTDLGFPGEGTQENPFIIEGLNITGSTGRLIEIEDTTAYFCIQNNLLDGLVGENIGLYLMRVTHGTIETNIITNCDIGIRVYSSKNITLSSNTIINCELWGIYLRSEQITMTHNTVYHCGEVGMYLSGSNQNIVKYNMISDCEVGIYLDDSIQNTLVGNQLFNNIFRIEGRDVEDYLQEQVVENVINGRPLIFWQNVQGGIIPKGAGQIILVNTTGVEVMGQDLTQVSVGVLAVFCTNLDIHNNSIANCQEEGIKMLHSSNNTITQNTITNNNASGIVLSASINTSVIHNFITNCDDGIILGRSAQNFVTDNTISNCRSAGIDLWNSAQNTLERNQLVNNGLSISGKDVEDYLQANVVANMINERPLVFWQSMTGGTIPPGAGQVVLVNTTGVEVTGQDLTQASIGVLAAFCEDLAIHNNILTHNHYGITLEQTGNIKITNNYIAHCIEGIYLLSSSGNTLTHNTIANNTDIGIHIEDSSEQNTLTHNTIANNTDIGIHIEDSSEQTLTYNTIANNTDIGILLDYSSEQNTLTHNTIANHRVGIYLYYSAQNTLLSNSLVNNGLFIEGKTGINPDTYEFEDNLFQAQVAENVVNGRPLVFWQNVRGGTIPPGAGQVVLVNTTGVEVTEQTLAGTSVGVLAIRCTNLAIHHNNISQNHIAGIQLDNSDNCIITHNTISNNTGDGIILFGSDRNNMTQNLIINNHVGIVLKWIYVYSVGGGFYVPSAENNITNNIFFQNRGYGIFDIALSNTGPWSDNTVQENDFLGNNLGDTSQIKVDRTYIIIHNFWTDHENTDQNGDGIADTPYPIESSNHDPSPWIVLANPLLGSRLPHSLLAPILIYPNGGEILQGSVKLHWVDAYDVGGHLVTYAVLYSADNGSTWTPLASELSSTTFEWDTTTVADGFAYRIRVIATCAEGLSADATSDESFTIRNIVHSLSAPTVIFPTGGETLQDTIALYWTPTNDTLEHPVNYMVSYSLDNGRTWTILATGLEPPRYEWDTTTVPDGSSYRLKVVATCAEGLTAEDSSDPSFTIQNQVSITTTVETFSHPGGPVGILLATLFLIILPILRIKRKFGD